MIARATPKPGATKVVDGLLIVPYSFTPINLRFPARTLEPLLILINDGLTKLHGIVIHGLNLPPDFYKRTPSPGETLISVV